jgi:malate dehydrogenase (oxaloacetate-decarboxylating)(NADP+)
MRTPKYNKGLAFTEAERDRLYLRGLLPPAVLSMETQILRVMINVRNMASNLERFSYLQSLQERNERLFFTVLSEHFEELLPSVHLPTVRQACETYGLMFKSLPRGLFLTSADLGVVQQVLKNWPERRIKVRAVLVWLMSALCAIDSTSIALRLCAACVT